MTETDAPFSIPFDIYNMEISKRDQEIGELKSKLRPPFSVPYDEYCREVSKRDIEIGALKEDYRLKLLERDKVLLIFKVRARIEELEKMFLPRSALSDNRRNKWEKIMRCNDEHYTKKTNLRSFRSTITVDIRLFIDTICLLHPDVSDAFAPRLYFYIPYDKEVIIPMFYNIGIEVAADDPKILVVELLLTPIK